MRAVRYRVNDREYFKRLFMSEGVPEDRAEELADSMGDPFSCVYTLIDEGNKSPQYDRYELTDLEGKPIHLSDLNGYEKGVVLADCVRHFSGAELKEGLWMFESAEEVEYGAGKRG